MIMMESLLIGKSHLPHHLGMVRMLDLMVIIVLMLTIGLQQMKDGIERIQLSIRIIVHCLHIPLLHLSGLVFQLQQRYIL